MSKYKVDEQGPLQRRVEHGRQELMDHTVGDVGLSRADGRQFGQIHSLSCQRRARILTKGASVAVTTAYGHIAVCIDRSAASTASLMEARALRAGAGPGRLSIVHVAPWPLLYAGEAGAWAPDPEDIASVAREWLDQVASDVPDAEAVLLDGYPPAEVCDWAHANEVDLLVAASHRGFVERVLLGSFAGYLVRNAPCSVLLTRPDEVTT